jgi:hypothetical protein
MSCDIGFTRLSRRSMLSPRSVTRLTPDSEVKPFKINLAAADAACRMTAKTFGGLIVRTAFLPMAPLSEFGATRAAPIVKSSRLISL